MENFQEPKLVKQIKIREYEMPYEYQQTGTDGKPRLFRRIYLEEEYEEHYSDGSIVKKTKSTLKPGEPQDLGEVENEPRDNTNPKNLKKAA